MTLPYLDDAARTKSPASLWIAFFAGPVAWACAQAVSYALIKPLCAGAAGFVVVALAAMAFACVGVGSWTLWRFLRLRRVSAQDERLDGTDGRYFTAIVALAFNGLIAILIVTASIPPFILSPCE